MHIHALIKGYKRLHYLFQMSIYTATCWNMEATSPPSVFYKNCRAWAWYWGWWLDGHLSIILAFFYQQPSTWAIAASLVKSHRRISPIGMRRDDLICMPGNDGLWHPAYALDTYICTSKPGNLGCPPFFYIASLTIISNSTKVERGAFISCYRLWE